MNELDINENAVETACDETPISEDIEILGESFHIEEFAPTVEEYRELVCGLYKTFYEQDLRDAVEKAISDERDKMRSTLEAELSLREQDIKESARLEVLNKITKKRLRPSENGILVQHRAPSRDVSRLTKEERAQAAKRAACGQIINFK